MKTLDFTTSDGAACSIDPRRVDAVITNDAVAVVYLNGRAFTSNVKHNEMLARWGDAMQEYEAQSFATFAAQLPGMIAGMMDEMITEPEPLQTHGTPATIDAAAVAREQHERWRILRDRSYSPYAVPWEQLTDDRKAELTAGVAATIVGVLHALDIDAVVINRFVPAEEAVETQTAAGGYPETHPAEPMPA